MTITPLNFENQHIEYKRCLNDRFEPAVIAFLNSSGGILYVGIDDNLTVYGVKNPDVVQRQIADRIKNNYQEHGKRLNANFAKNLDLLTPDGKYNLNAFLFADQNTTTIKVAKFAGTNKTQLVENEDYGYCSIIKSCKKVLDKLELENRTFAKVSV